MVSRLKKLYRLIKWYRFLSSSGYDKNKKYYVLKYGIGDTYLVSTLLPYVADARENVVLLIEKGNQCFIPAMFDKYIEVREVVGLPYSMIDEFGNRNTGQPIVLHSDCIKGLPLSNLLGYKNFTLVDIYKVMLGLKLNLIPATPKSHSTLSEELSNKISIYKNLVLLCPQANSIATVEPEFWIEIAKFLKERNFTPVFMNDTPSNEFDSITFPLNESISLCNKIRGIISLRSGFCDLISSCSIAKIILYPKIQWYSGSLLQGSGLNSMGLSNEKLLELEVSNFVGDSNLFKQIEGFLNE